MERVKTLVEKLQKQVDNNDSPLLLLHTVRMLQAELAILAENSPTTIKGKVAVVMPVVHDAGTSDVKKEASSVKEEEKIIEVLQVDESEIEKELEEIRKRANTMSASGQQTSIQEEFDPLEDVPTLAQQDHPVTHQKAFQGKIEYPEINEAEELNDKLKQIRTELSESLTSTPIRDLRKAVGVNDRFIFINELFRGDETMYERSIKTIQSFSIYAEAEFWIRRELRLKLGWSNTDPVVKQFDELIKRRFM